MAHYTMFKIAELKPEYQPKVEISLQEKIAIDGMLYELVDETDGYALVKEQSDDLEHWAIIEFKRGDGCLAYGDTPYLFGAKELVLERWVELVD